MKNIKLISKLSTLILTFVLTGGYLVGCSSSSNKDVSSLEKIKSKGVLVVGTAPGYPPFEFIKSSNGKGEVVGADIDLAKKIASELDVKLEIKAMEFDSILGALQGNKIRSEEHTSELQSRQYLVCRLLLEKKKHMH